MKVISIKQPWASLIIYGYKKYEFRSWKTKYRGELHIHASQTSDKKNLEKFKEYNIPFDTGCIIGKVIFKDCLLIDEKLNGQLKSMNNDIYGDKDREGYAWEIEDPQKINNIYCKGRLNIWEYKKDS